MGKRGVIAVRSEGAAGRLPPNESTRCRTLRHFASPKNGLVLKCPKKTGEAESLGRHLRESPAGRKALSGSLMPGHYRQLPARRYPAACAAASEGKVTMFWGLICP